MLDVQLPHEAIAVDLCDHGRGGDREREGVAVVELGLRAAMVEAHGIDQEMVGREGEALYRGQHGDARGLVDVDAVNGLGVHLGDGDGQGDLADAAVELFAVLAQKLLGVLESGAGQAGHPLGQNDGGGDHGAEKRAATYLVHTGDGAKAAVTQGLFRRVAADQQLEHALFRSGGRDDACGARRRSGNTAHIGFEFTTLVCEDFI